MANHDTCGLAGSLTFTQPAPVRLRRAGPGRAPCDDAADALWAEHGWGLTGWQATGLVSAILFASAALRLLS